MFITIVPGQDLPVFSAIIGGPVKNRTGESIGRVQELIMNKHGQITTVLIDVGSFVGVAGKTVAIPFTSIVIDASAAGRPSIVVQLDKQELAQAPEFKWTGQSPLGRLRDQGAALGEMAAAKASELIHKAAEKASVVGEMAVGKASDLGHKAAEKATELGHKAAEKATELGHRAAEKASEIGHKVVEKTSELTRKVATPANDPGQPAVDSRGEVEGGSQSSSKD